MRIAIGGFHIEASTYNPTLTKGSEFTVAVGDKLKEHGFFKVLEEYDFECLPIFYATANSGAPIESSFYESIKSQFLSSLAELLPVDGVHLSLHGSAFVEGMQDAEGDFIEAVRNLVGPEVPISGSFDLHGNVSQRMIDNLNIFTAYRTAPHVDHEDTLRRGLNMLVRSIATGVRPHLCWSPIPVVLQGERTVTTSEPGTSLYARLPILEENKNIWDASLMVGFVWSDEPRVNAAAVVTGTDVSAIEVAARGLAQAYFDARHDFKFDMQTGTIEESVTIALEAIERPAFISDSGDNVTAGGPGDRVDVLKSLQERGVQNALVAGIVDLEATTAAYAAGTDTVINIKLGGSLVPGGAAPLYLECRVLHLLDTPYPARREAILEMNGVRIITTASRKAFSKLEDYTRLGIDLAEESIVVVKLGYLFPQLIPFAGTSVMALSEGIVDQLVERLPRTLTPVPTFPFQKDFDFAPRVYWSRFSGI